MLSLQGVVALLHEYRIAKFFRFCRRIFSTRKLTFLERRSHLP